MARAGIRLVSSPCSLSIANSLRRRDQCRGAESGDSRGSRVAQADRVHRSAPSTAADKQSPHLTLPRGRETAVRTRDQRRLGNDPTTGPSYVLRPWLRVVLQAPAAAASAAPASWTPDHRIRAWAFLTGRSACSGGEQVNHIYVQPTSQGESARRRF